jgi:hypothetical protein
MPEAITIVSGLPRTGTSMMMSMLESGGMDVVTDHQRKADVDNPRGYFELEVVKGIERDSGWLRDTQGKVFKMVATLLLHLPPDYDYQILFMQRDMREMLRSQAKMLHRLGQPESGIPDERMASMFHGQLTKVNDWLHTQPNIRVLFLKYRDVLSHPREQALRINAFLDQSLNIPAMAAAVDPALWRNKG